MRVWTNTEKFLSWMPHLVEDQLRRTNVNYSGIVDPELAKKHLPADAYQTFLDLSAGGAKVTNGDLAKAYLEKTKPLIQEAAGDNAWLSIAEARALPPAAKKAYGAFKNRERYSKAYQLSLDVPFPGGIVDHGLFFKRHLPMLRKRAALAVIEKGDVLARLAELDKKLAAGPIQLADGTKIEKEADAISIRGPGGDARIEIEHNGFTLHSGGESWGGMRYEAESIFESHAKLLKGLKKSGAVAGLLGKEKRTESENIFDRFPHGDDVPGTLILAKALDGAVGDGARGAELDAAAKVWLTRHEAAVGEYLKRSKTSESLAQIRKDIQELGEQCIGDADLTIALRDALTDTVYDEDDNEKEITLLSGRGPLLTFENHASGASFAVELNALDQGNLVIHDFYEGQAGMVKLGSDGKAEISADFRSLYGTTFDIDWAKSELAEIRAGS